MLLVPTKHIVLVTDPAVTPPLPTDRIDTLLHNCDLWWRSYGVDLALGPVEVRYPHRINLASEDPWPQVASWWMEQPDYDPSVRLVVLLSGWRNPYWIGWGGRLGNGTGGLSVVGDYALYRLASVPLTPDDATDPEDSASLVDDWDAGQLLLHEQGHALGLPHDFSYQPVPVVMGYQWDARFNVILGETSAAEFDRLWPGARFAPETVSAARRVDLSGELLIQACRVPSG